MGEETNISDTCPKCEAGNKRWDFRTGSGYNYACGTLFEESTKKCVESRFCITAQRDQLATELQTLRTANAALVERVKRLEAAGDDVLNAAWDVQCWKGTRLGDCLDQWEAAKGQS